MSADDITIPCTEKISVDGLLTPKTKEDADKIFDGLKNEYYIDRAGPETKRYSKPRIVDFSPNLTEEDKTEMRRMMLEALEASTTILREEEAQRSKKKKEEKRATPHGVFQVPQGTPFSSSAPPEVYEDNPSFAPSRSAPTQSAPRDAPDIGMPPAIPQLPLSAPTQSGSGDAYGAAPNIGMPPAIPQLPLSAPTQSAPRDAPDIGMSTGTSASMDISSSCDTGSEVHSSPSISQSGGIGVSMSQSQLGDESGKGESFAVRWERAMKDMVINGMSGDGNDSGNKRYKAYEDLMSVCKDFQAAAAMYGRIVLSEATLKGDERTIKTKDVGGIAGGTKYKVSDKILFKSPKVDAGSFKYPNYDAAAKVSGHELKSATHLFCTLVTGEIYKSKDKKKPTPEELEMIRDMIMVPPLMALVEYMGYRTVAMTLLPVGEVPMDNYGDRAEEKDADGDVRMGCKGCGTQNGECCRHCGMHHCDARLCPDCKVPRQGDSCDVCKRPIQDNSDSIVIEDPASKAKSTLIYGSADALKHISWDSEVHRILEKVCDKLNLSEHKVEKPGKKCQTPSDPEFHCPSEPRSNFDRKYWTPFDLEVHRSSDPRSNSKYILDLSRLFPSAVSMDQLSGPTYLYRLFRPELVKSSNVAISSDWVKQGTPEEKQMAYDLLDRLEGDGVPIEDDKKEVKKEILPFLFAEELSGLPREYFDDLIFRLHSGGINVRYLGLVYARLWEKHRDSDWCCRVAAEIVARSLRKIINERLREDIRCQTHTEFGTAKYITETLNSMFRGEPEIWRRINDDIHGRFIFKKKGYSFEHDFSIRDISPVEIVRRREGFEGVRPEDVTGRGFGPVVVMKLLSTFLGLTWYNDVWNAFVNDPTFFESREPFSSQALLEIRPRVKQMNIAYHANGVVMERFFHNLRDQKKSGKISAIPMYAVNSVLSSYFDGLQSTPSSSATLRRYMKAVDEYMETLTEEELKANESKLEALNSKVNSMCKALAEDKKDDNSLFFAAVHYEKLGEVENARRLYEMAKGVKARANTYLMYADSYFETNYVKAKELYNEGISIDKNSKLYGNLGVLELKNGNVMAGWKSLTTALKESKKSKLKVAGKNCAVFCLFALGDEELAREVCKHISLHEEFFKYG